MTFKVGEYTFHECNVAFHLCRENVYSPWVIIGIYLTHHGYQNARYNRFNQDIVKAFKAELKMCDSKYIRGGPEFLESWRLRYQDPLDVITPVINYCTSYSGNLCDVLSQLFTTYVGCCSSLPFAKLMLMIKLRKQFFPNIFRNGKNHSDFVETLERAGIQWMKT